MSDVTYREKNYIRTSLKKIRYFIVFLLIAPLLVNAQQRGVVLKYENIQVAQTLQKLGWNDTLTFLQTGENAKWMHTLQWALANEGFLASSIEKTDSDSLYDRYHITPGKCYRQATIVFSEDLKTYETRFRHSENAPFTPSWLQKQVMGVIQQLENNGYPYAMIESKVLHAGDSSINLMLSLEKGSFVVIDTIMIVGGANLHPVYLSSYLGIAAGDPYNEKAIRQIDAWLDRLKTARRTRNTQVVLLKNSAVIKVFLEDRRTDRFDGIVGFAPNSAQATGQGILFTGEVNFEMNNLFGRGIESAVNWRKYLAASQDLGIAFLYPYLFKTPLFFGVDGHITRFDSLFIDSRINWKVGVFQQGNRQWGLQYGKQNTSLITVDTVTVRKSGRLPANNPMEISSYGINLLWNQTNRAINPRSGFKLFGQIALGVRNLKRDPGIDKVIFYSDLYPSGISIYDTLEKRSLRGEVLMDHTVFVPAFKNAAFAFRFLGNYLISEKVYLNELYRLGGFSTLQGFDERAIFAHSFSMLRTEYRYLLNEASYAGIFVNAAFAENRSEQMSGLSGLLYGAGAHVQINTGRSSLQLAYALGTAQGEPISLRNAKFHFGLINYLR